MSILHQTDDNIQSTVPIEPVIQKLVEVVKMIQSRVPEGTSLPEIVDRVVEPVAMMIFQGVLNELDPNWTTNIIDHYVHPSKDSFWMDESETIQ